MTVEVMNEFELDTQSIKEHFFENGFYVSPVLFSMPECHALIEEAHRLDLNLGAERATIMMPHRTSEIFAEVMRSVKIKRYLELFIDGKISGLQTQFFFSKPGTKGFSKHQDNFFVRAPSDAFVSAWLALVDCHKGNGGLVVYPESHKRGLLPVQQTNVKNSSAQDPNANKVETVLQQAKTPALLDVPAGTVVFIHGDVVHASMDNQSTSDRCVLLNTYIKQGAPFRPGDRAKRAEVPL